MSISPVSIADTPVLTITNLIEVGMCDNSLEGVIIVFSNGSVKLIAARDLGQGGLDKLEAVAKDAHITMVNVTEAQYCGTKG